MKYFPTTFLFVLLITFPSVAQNFEVEGLRFGVTTSADAIARFGKPKKDRIDQVSFQPAVSDSIISRKDIRKLVFDDLGGWKQVELSFLDDKLFTLMFWPKNKTLKAAELSRLAQADFLLVEGFARSVPLSSYEGQKETTIPKVYPARYHMVSVSSDRYVIALVNNGSFKAIFKDAYGKPTIAQFPGYLENVIIQSRSLEKH